MTATKVLKFSNLKLPKVKMLVIKDVFIVHRGVR